MHTTHELSVLLVTDNTLAINNRQKHQTCRLKRADILKILARRARVHYSWDPRKPAFRACEANFPAVMDAQMNCTYSEDQPLKTTNCNNTMKLIIVKIM